MATLTAAEIQATLDREHQLWVTRDGVRYYVGEDEDATGLYAWREDAMAGNGASFGEADYPDVMNSPPDYRAVSERIAAWLAGGSA